MLLQKNSLFCALTALSSYLCHLYQIVVGVFTCLHPLVNCVPHLITRLGILYDSFIHSTNIFEHLLCARHFSNMFSELISYRCSKNTRGSLGWCKENIIWIKKTLAWENSLAAEWLKLSAFTAIACVQFLVGKLRSCKLHGVAKKQQQHWDGIHVLHIQSFVCQFFWALVFLAVKWGCGCCCLVAQSCPTLCYTTDCSPPVAPLSMGILQARVLEWVSMPSSRESAQPRDRTQVSCIAGRFFTTEPPRKSIKWGYHHLIH